MFKPGDKIVCNKLFNWYDTLIIGKTYTISSLRFGSDFFVLNEHPGVLYSNDRFISLKEYRKQKLKKLNNVQKRR